MRAKKQQQKTKQKYVESEEETVELGAIQDYDEAHYTTIDSLEEMGINVADISKLKAAGYCTINAVIMVMKKDLENIKGMTSMKVEKIVEAARKIQKFGFMTGTELETMRKKVIKLTTGSSKLDKILGGGIESMSITEAFGQFRTGKTQLAHTLCVTAQLPKESGGGGGKVIYIDTECTFRPQNIKRICQRYKLDSDKVLENISYSKAFTSENMLQLITISASLMMQSHYSLIIIDSLMACFRTDYVGRGQLSQRQQQLGKMLNKLMKLAEQFNVAVYITNQVMADPGNSMAHADTKKPIGGHVLAHASTTRLYFKKGKGDERVMQKFDKLAKLWIHRRYLSAKKPFRQPMEVLMISRTDDQIVM